MMALIQFETLKIEMSGPVASIAPANVRFFDMSPLHRIYRPSSHIFGLLFGLTFFCQIYYAMCCVLRMNGVLLIGAGTGT